MTFQLDATGFVARQDGGHFSINNAALACVRWSDLDPFTQGYVEKVLWAAGGQISPTRLYLGFSDLAPETLARIVEDCARFRSYGEHEGFKCCDDTGEHGRQFWEKRNWRPWPAHAAVYERDGFPPLTAYLGDDGKVYLR